MITSARAQLCRLSVPRRDHQPRRLAVLPVPARAADGGGVTGPRHHCEPRNGPAVGLKIWPTFANRVRRWLPRTGDKWHLDEVVLGSPVSSTGCGAPVLLVRSMPAGQTLISGRPRWRLLTRRSLCGLTCVLPTVNDPHGRFRNRKDDLRELQSRACERTDGSQTRPWREGDSNHRSP
jgi:hypothetical protein